MYVCMYVCVSIRQEILTWLGSGWPDNDDAAMMKAQAEGVRLRWVQY